MLGYVLAKTAYERVLNGPAAGKEAWKEAKRAVISRSLEEKKEKKEKEEEQQQQQQTTQVPTAYQTAREAQEAAFMRSIDNPSESTMLLSPASSRKSSDEPKPEAEIGLNEEGNSHAPRRGGPSGTRGTDC